jgi:hypothetical protein
MKINFILKIVAGLACSFFVNCATSAASSLESIAKDKNKSLCRHIEYEYEKGLTVKEKLSYQDLPCEAKSESPKFITEKQKIQNDSIATQIEN